MRAPKYLSVLERAGNAVRYVDSVWSGRAPVTRREIHWGAPTPKGGGGRALISLSLYQMGELSQRRVSSRPDDETH